MATQTSSTGPIVFGCVGSFSMQESEFHKYAAGLLQEMSALLAGDDDYECRSGRYDGNRVRNIKLHLPYGPHDSKLLWVIRQLMIRVNHHLTAQSVVILKTAGRTSTRYTLMPAGEVPNSEPAPIAHRRMAVVSRTAKGKPSVTWYQVPIYERDKIDTDTYARAIAMARADGRSGNLEVFSENDADLLREMVNKLEAEAKRRRSELTGRSTGGRLVMFGHHLNNKK
ncbi:MAG: hypothetical protein ACM3ZT_01390 [Bacillota bacterium]